MVTELLFTVIKNILEIYSGDAQTLWIKLMYTKMPKMATFMLYMYIIATYLYIP